MLKVCWDLVNTCREQGLPFSISQQSILIDPSTRKLLSHQSIPPLVPASLGYSRKSNTTHYPGIIYETWNLISTRSYFLDLLASLPPPNPSNQVIHNLGSRLKSSAQSTLPLEGNSEQNMRHDNW